MNNCTTRLALAGKWVWPPSIWAKATAPRPPPKFSRNCRRFMLSSIHEKKLVTIQNGPASVFESVPCGEPLQAAGFRRARIPAKRQTVDPGDLLAGLGRQAPYARGK